MLAKIVDKLKKIKPWNNKQKQLITKDKPTENNR